MADTSDGATYSIRKTRRGYESLLARNPHGTGQWDLLLPDKKLNWVALQGMGACKELAHTVRWALTNPRHIFRGVRDDKWEIDEDEWLCYIATPRKAFVWTTGAEVPAWEDEVFLIYVTDERVVYNWFWDDCTQDDTTLPCGHEERFTKRVF